MTGVRGGKSILLAASEAAPIIAESALGEYTGALSYALRMRGDDVRTIIPLYSSVPEKYKRRAEKIASITVPLAWRQQECTIFRIAEAERIFYLIENQFCFERNALRGECDDGERFALFSAAVLEMLPHIGYFPDVIHSLGRESALIPVYLRENYKSHIYSGMKSVHTFFEEGESPRFQREMLSDVFGLNGSSSVLSEDGSISLTRGAALCCDACVFPGVTGGRYGASAPLRAEKAFFVSEGINTVDFDPSTDSELPCRYDSFRYDGKNCCRAELRRRLGLPEGRDIPVFLFVPPLSGDSELLESAAERILSEDIQLVVLGGSGFTHAFSDRFFDKLCAVHSYDRRLLRLALAGSDILINPCRAARACIPEMLGARYGAIPLVYRGDGMERDGERIVIPDGSGTVFAFEQYSAESFTAELLRAARFIIFERKRLENISRREMRRSFSVCRAANEYAVLYEKITAQNYISISSPVARE